jgi:NADP-dependent 3-hydroxy acid dehydrogenase YdfG
MALRKDGGALRVLITGAGSGLGRALALRFAAAGWRVGVTDLRTDAAAATLQAVKAAGAEGFAAALDVTSEASFADVAERLQREWRGVDVLINNAGVATSGTVQDSPVEQWRWVLDINLLGCVRGCRAIAPLLTAQNSGHIVNIASFAGISNPPALASYNAAKAAVISLSETLRFEMFPHHVGVSVACPSFFRTALLDTSRSAGDENLHSTAPQMDRIVDKLMERAEVTAEDVAADIFDAVQQNRFMVITHPDSRRLALLKRVSPELYFRKAQKSTAGFLVKR